MSNRIKKSIQDLESAADELLQKSTANNNLDPKKDEPKKDEPVGDELKPEDIVDDKKESEPEQEKPDDNLEKSEGNTGVSKENENEAEENEELDESNEEVEKSLNKSLDTPVVSQAVEVSNFLSAVVDAITGSLSVMGGQIHKSNSDTSSVLGALTKSIQAIAIANTSAIEQANATQELCKSMMAKFDELNSKLDAIGSQPMTRKSVSNMQVMDRNFAKSMGENTMSQLSKSQVLSVLSDELYRGNPNVSAADIISYESGAPLRPEVQDLVMNKIR